MCVWSGIDDEIAKEELERLKNLSSIRRQEILEAARRSFCHRQAKHLKLSFSQAVAFCNKYQTTPEIVCYDNNFT